MTYYILKAAFQDETGLIPSLYLNLEIQDIFRMKEQLTNTSFYQTNNPIPFWLDEKEGVASRILDINKWTKSEPAAHKIIISPRFKEILEGFTLPAHRFYDSYGFVASKKRTCPLFVFHFHFDYIQEIILQETTFQEKHTRAKSIVKRPLEKGSILKPEDFYLFAEENAEVTYWFYPDKLRFKPGVYYDVFATEDGIIVNEKIKQAIEIARIKGVEVIEYKAYEIIMSKENIP